MRSRRHRLLGVLLAAGFGLGMFAGAPGAALAQNLSWEACGDGFECATLKVPRDYGNHRAGSFELAVIRLPAKGERSQRIGSLFLNPGGPGGSGVDFLRSAAEAFAPLNDRFDLVSWDPRGVGVSMPAVNCGARNQETGNGPFAQPFPTPFDRAGEQAFAQRVIAYAGDCEQRNRGVLPYISTLNTVYDLDRLRAAVGDGKLSYLGFSYGTVIGATYASVFPHRHRALALDGAVDADGWLNAPIKTIREQTQGFEQALDRFFAACAGNQESCLGFGGEDPEIAYDELIERAAKTALPAPNAPFPEPVDADDIRLGTLLTLYAKQAWPILSVALASAQAGDASLFRVLTDAFNGREEDGTYGPGIDQFVSIWALEGRKEGPVETYLQAGRDAYGLFDHFWFNNGYGDLSIGVWPVRPDAVYRGPFRNRSNAPTALVVGTTYDPATPYIWSRRLTKQLGNARLLTMRGDGHTASFGGNTPCIDTAVEAYLEKLMLPAEGTVCRQEVPFVLPEIAAQSRGAAAAQLRPHVTPLAAR